MRKTILLFAILLATIGCNLDAGEPSVIKLSVDEKKQAQSIAEQRQQIGYERQEAANAYQAQVDRLNEREGALNVQANRLCFQLNKSHGLDPTKHYRLDEWRGELRR